MPRAALDLPCIYLLRAKETQRDGRRRKWHHMTGGGMTLLEHGAMASGWRARGLQDSAASLDQKLSH